ncbi:hypothetical protein M1L60_06565 [Actinoplanes sp. TRM 88003]|uniref:Uncharacterized protein n=1 Tax=Paractinoplanes aksuensis TaxID=2939490 RepID=A0ABT1DHD7_9ACTN|nr:hypothetical protein [Actinoplanes aksuensis]MCO8270256.1 hypothetical protein [Actinoplanes aksuensis]
MRLWRSLDLVLTSAVALTVGVLGMLNLAEASVLAGATLATLGVLAAGSLTARLQMHGLTDLTRRHLVEPPSADRLLTTSTSGLDADLSHAWEIGLIGVTLNRTIRNHSVELRACVERGGTVRIAVIDPRGDVLDEAARRSTSPGTAEIFAHRLQPTLDLAAALTALPGPGRAEVRLLDFVPAVGLLAVDTHQPHGRLHVDIYSHTFGGREPALALEPGRDHTWFQHFQAEFDQIWTAGRPAFVSGGQFH